MKPINNNQPQSWLEKVGATLAYFESDRFREELQTLIKRGKNPERKGIKILLFLGAVLTFYTLYGAILGYKRAYYRFMKPKDELPRLTHIPRIVKVAMVIGAILAWLIPVSGLIFISMLNVEQLLRVKFILMYLGINLVLSFGLIALFKRWRTKIHEANMEDRKYASARWATDDDLKEYQNTTGLYLGKGLATQEKGHFMTLASTRSGKGVNLIVPNILNVKGYKGSMFILDVKGENLAITQRALEKQGKKVIAINPFNLLPHAIKGKSSYNPFSLFSDKASLHLVSDIQIVTECLIPLKADDKNSFFTSNARSILTSLILHMVTSPKVKEPTLTLLWEWCRYTGEAWDSLLAEMAASNDPVHGKAVRNGAQEVLKHMGAMETYSSIISNIIEATSFVQSAPIQQALEPGFDPYILADGNTYVFLIVPPDMLATNSVFLRLVIITMMRAVVRRPNKRVTFMIDEAYSALKYMSEIPVALSSYAGYELSLWLIYQDLNQLRDVYGDLFESMWANCTWKTVFGVRDNFSAEYISTAIGSTTKISNKRDLKGELLDTEAYERVLATPDEVKRMSKDTILLFAAEHPAAQIPKHPYWLMPELKDRSGNNLYDPNPYIKDGK